MLCRHCNTKKVCRPRGLCWNCYYKPGVREMYSGGSKCEPKPDQTEAELDAIAERSKPENLPAWWFEEKCQAHE